MEERMTEKTEERIRKRISCLLLTGLLLLGLTISGGCSLASRTEEAQTAAKESQIAAAGARTASAENQTAAAEEMGTAGTETGAGMENEESLPGEDTGPSLPGLAWEGRMELQYAENFSVDYYEGGYTLLTTIPDGARFLIVPEGKEAPQELAEGMSVTILSRPVERLYLVSSSVMDLFCALDGLSAVSFSGQEADGWYIDEAREAMEAGELVYAGKYNKPDYELLLSGSCSLAIENRMISHAPEVTEKLADFGIPSLIEYSSYESHPLGRVEWVKFFGALLGKEEKAEEIFAEQTRILDQVTAEEGTDKTVAFFYITSNGLVQVRQSSDYVPKMIELAGGKYIFEDLGDPDSGRSTMNMQVEEFYEGAKDADYIIYNSAIDGGVPDLDGLIDKCPLLEDFRAVQEGNAWCTARDLYQQSLSIGYLIGDIHTMLQGGSEEEMTYLYHLD